MSFWGIWRRSPKDPEPSSATTAIEHAWLALIKDEQGLRDNNSHAREKIASRITEIADIIRAEEKTSTRRVCLQYALDHGIFTKIAELTRKCGPSIITESSAAFSVLIKSGEEDLMSNDQVIKSINVFIRELSKARGDRVAQDEAAEMLFSVASRLRAEPQSIMKWIRSSEPESEESSPAPEIAHKQSIVHEEDLPEMIFELPRENTEDLISSTHESDTPIIDDRPGQGSDLNKIDGKSNDSNPQTQVDTEDWDLESERAAVGHEAAETAGRDQSEDDNEIDIEGAADAIDNLITDLRVQSNNDFPVFYFLLDFIHHEGRAGEFARTGLLFIVESAYPNSNLEEWILASDFGTLMASGLGALYSQLSRTMLRAFQATSEPKIVSMAKESERKFVPIAVGESVPGVEDPVETAMNNDHLKEFLSYLEFWQDTLSHCRSDKIRTSLLENFETLFLRQLLVPSLAESADADGSVSGGTAIAVLTYLRAIFESLNQKDIVNLILTSLMVHHDTDLPKPVPAVSYDNGEEDDEEDRIPIRITKTSFSLVDLVTESLESSSQQAIGAALRLISTLVRKHYPYTLDSLFQVRRLSDKFEPTVTPFTVYAEEMDFFLSLMPDENAEIVSQTYDRYLRDSRLALESHPFLPRVIARTDEFDDESRQNVTELYSHTIKIEDKTWNDLLRLFSLFFANSVELNLVLTGVFIDLISCGWLSLRGFILVRLEDVSVSHDRPKLDDDSDDELDYQMLVNYADNDSDSDENWGVHPNERFQETKLTKLSPVMELLKILDKKIDEYRQKIPGFDDKLNERRQMLREDEDDIGDTMAVAFSSPQVRVQSPDSKRFSLTPLDSQKRAQELFQSSSTPSSPASVTAAQYRAVSGSSMSSARRSPMQPRAPPPRRTEVSPLSNRAHRRAESVAGGPPSAAKMRQHRRVQSTVSPFTSPGVFTPPPLRTRDSVKAFESLERVTTNMSATSPVSFSESRFDDDEYSVASRSPADFASALVLSEAIHVQSDDEDEVVPVSAGAPSESGTGKDGLEMDDIVTDIGYVPAVIQVMGPETGNSRYVSVAHLLGNVIVYEEFVKELTAMIQVRSTLVDRVDYRH